MSRSSSNFSTEIDRKTTGEGGDGSGLIRRSIERTEENHEGSG